MDFEIVNAVLVISGMIIVTMSFILCLPRRFPLAVVVVSFVAYTAVILAVNRFTGHMDRLPLPTGWAYIPLVLVLFKGSAFQKIFLLFASLFLSLSIILFFSMLYGFFLPYGSVDIFVMMIISVSLASIAYIILASRFGKRFMKSFFEGGSRKEWALYMATAIVAYTFLFILRRIHAQNSLVHFGALLFLIWSFFILLYAIVNTHEKARKSHEADFAQGVISAGRGHYRKMNELYEALRLVRHDNKYHLKTIGELLNSGNIEETKRYLSGAQAGMPDADLRHYCTNPVINALVGSYAERCAKERIGFEAEFSLPEALSVTNYDMCIVLGNLLENAVEACLKPAQAAASVAAGVAGSERRPAIELAVKAQGEFLAVMVKNSFSGFVATDSGSWETGLPVSTKKGGGYGLRSVNAVAGRYGGSVDVKWNGGAFTVCVVMKNREE